MQYEYKMLIKGEWTRSAKTVEVRNPFNNDLIGLLPSASGEQVEEALVTSNASTGVIRFEGSSPATATTRFLRAILIKSFRAGGIILLRFRLIFWAR